MLTLRQNLRKELAYAIVDAWAYDEKGKEKILDAFFYNGRCAGNAVCELIHETHFLLGKGTDKTFLCLLNTLYEDLRIALDDWIDVYKIMFYNDYLERERKGKERFHGYRDDKGLLRRDEHDGSLGICAPYGVL